MHVSRHTVTAHARGTARGDASRWCGVAASRGVEHLVKVRRAAGVEFLAESAAGAWLRGRGQEHFRGGDNFPTGGVMLAAPELVKAELVQPVDQIQVGAQLQHRVLTDRVMRREECAKFHTGHGCLLPGNRRSVNAYRCHHSMPCWPILPNAPEPHGRGKCERQLPPSIG